MSQRQAAWQSVIDMPRAFGRRAWMKLSVLGGAAFGASAFSGFAAGPQSDQDQKRRQSDLDLLKTLPVAHRRRVVTGHNAEGKSYIVSDEVIADSSTIGGHMDLWATDPAHPLGLGPAGEPSGILPTTSPHVDPVKGGTRWYVATLPAGANGTATFANRLGMHRTLTIDYVFVLSGEITMLMDIPPAVNLKAGDVIVQRNTVHAWRVGDKQPVSLLASLVRVDK